MQINSTFPKLCFIAPSEKHAQHYLSLFSTLTYTEATNSAAWKVLGTAIEKSEDLWINDLPDSSY